MSGEDESGLVDSIEVLVYALFLPAIVFLGPLKTFAGLVLYWLIRPEEGA